MSKITLLILLCMLSYTGMLVAISRAPLQLNSNLVGIIINSLATLVPVGMFMFMASHRANPTGGSLAHGIGWAVFGGLCIGVFTLGITLLFASGQSVSFVAPLVYGFAVLASSLIAMIFFAEKTPPLVMAGLLFIVIGIGAISLSAYREGKNTPLRSDKQTNTALDTVND